MTAHARDSWFAWLNYLAIVLIWGSTYYATAVAFSTFTPMGLLIVRFLIAAMLCFAVAIWRREQWPKGLEWLHLSVVGIGMLGASNALVVWAIQYIATGMAAVFMASTVLWLVVFGLERVSTMKLLGVILGVVGVAILVSPNTSDSLHQEALAALFAAPILWALGTLYAKRYLKGQSRFMQLAVEMFTASSFGIALAPSMGGVMSGSIQMATVLALFYLSVFGSFIAYAAYFYIVEIWEPSRVGTFSYLTPVIAIFLGTVLLDEKLGLRHVVGISTVLMAVALVQLRNKSRSN